MSKEAITFEEAFAQLEAAVHALQNGNLSLDEAMSHYEDGMKLTQYCNQLLQSAELRIQKLQIDDEGQPVARPFEV